MVLARADLRRVVTVSLMMPLISIPLLVFFFPILPRTQLPLWNLFPSPITRSSGFTDKVEPGGNSSVGESATLAFRAELPRQPRQQLYWRGTVFNQLVGNRWVRDAAVPAEIIVYGASRNTQVIFPEPGHSRFLLALDAPVNVDFLRSRRYADGVFEMTSASGRHQSYSVEASTAGNLPVVSKINRSFYVQLPDTVPVRLRSLAKEIRSRGATDAERVELLKDFFRKNEYRYSLQGLPTGDHAIEQFLFETKQGHCEFFASAFAIVARAANIPTRLVGGYLGGEYNELGGYYLVTEQMAHVWVEVLIDKAWVRIDPSSIAVNAGGVWSDSRSRSLGMRLRMAVDSFDHAWNRSVITYDFERQATVARSVGKRLQGFSVRNELTSAGRPLLLLGGGTVIWLLIVNRRRLIKTPEERLLLKFYRQLQRDTGIKFDKSNRQGMFEIAAVTGNLNVRAFADIYAGAVYRDRRLTPQEIAGLKQLIRSGFAG